MSDKVVYWSSVVFGALALLLLIANISLVSGNRTLQVEIAARQNAISGAVSMSQLDQSLAQALAQAAVKDDDQEIRDLLAAQGITIKNKGKSEKSERE